MIYLPARCVGVNDQRVAEAHSRLNVHNPDQTCVMQCAQKVFRPPLRQLSLARQARSRESPVCSALPPFKTQGGRDALGNPQCSRKVFYSFSFHRSVS